MPVIPGPPFAAQYGLTAAELKAYNPVWLECVATLNTACRTEPKAGDDLLIPSLTGETVIGRGTTYTIKAGENLLRIAVRTGYTVADLLTAIKPKSRILRPYVPAPFSISRAPGS